jgi:hypothetical protein
MPLGLKDSQGNAIAVHEDGRPYSQAEFWREYIDKNLTSEQREEITAISLESRNLGKAREREIKEAQSKGDSLFKERAEVQQKNKEQWNNDLKSAIQSEVAKLGEVAKKQVVPTNATAVEKALIDAKNARIDRAAGIIQRYISEASPQNLAKMSTTTAFHETVFPDILKEKDGTIDEWKHRAEAVEAKLDAIKKAGKTTDRDGAPPPAQKKSNNAAEINDPEERMAAYMSGEAR